MIKKIVQNIGLNFLPAILSAQALLSVFSQGFPPSGLETHVFSNTFPRMRGQSQPSNAVSSLFPGQELDFSSFSTSQSILMDFKVYLLDMCKHASPLHSLHPCLSPSHHVFSHLGTHLPPTKSQFPWVLLCHPSTTRKPEPSFYGTKLPCHFPA